MGASRLRVNGNNRFVLFFSPEVAVEGVAGLLLIREIRVQISAQSHAAIFRRVLN